MRHAEWADADWDHIPFWSTLRRMDIYYILLMNGAPAGLYQAVPPRADLTRMHHSTNDAGTFVVYSVTSFLSESVGKG